MCVDLNDIMFLNVLNAYINSLKNKLMFKCTDFPLFFCDGYNSCYYKSYISGKLTYFEAASLVWFS